MGLMAPVDALFLASESPDHPKHVAAVQVFELPSGASRRFVRDLYDDLLAHHHIAPLFAKLPAASHGLGSVWWTEENRVDLTQHVRLASLGHPYGTAELFDYVSREHAIPLDRSRPLWEYHVIEQVAGDRFAIYLKLHHSLADGVAILRHIAESLSPDPTGESIPVWATRADSAEPASRPTPPVPNVDRGRRVGAAPKTPLNRPIDGRRQFIGHTWPIDRLRAVARRAGTDVTANDAFLAMCSGALRQYLLVRDDLPVTSLTASVPVAGRGSWSVGGNRFGFAACDLATDLDMPLDRLAAVTASTARAKAALAQRSTMRIQLRYAARQIGLMAIGKIPRLAPAVLPLTNIVIANVPGPRAPMYLRGARAVEIYPAAIALDYSALNITAITYDGGVHVGLVCCPTVVNPLSDLLEYLEKSLAELERAAP